MHLSDCFYLGYISRAIGTEGRVIIKMDVDDPSQYRNLESVLVQLKKGDQQPVPFFISKTKSLKGNLLEVELDIGHLTIPANSLKGKTVHLPLSMLPDLSGNQFYFHEIVGFRVIDNTHGSIGIVKEVMELPSDPVLVILNNEKEILIPITNEVVQKVDRSAQEIQVETPEGLIEVYLD